MKRRKPQAASRKPQAASRKPQAASRKPQAASRKPQYRPRLTLPPDPAGGAPSPRRRNVLSRLLIPSPWRRLALLPALLLVGAFLLLAAAPGWAQTTMYGRLHKRCFQCDPNHYFRGTWWDRLVLTWLSPEDGTFDMNLHPASPTPPEPLTYSTPTVTVVDEDGTAVAVTVTAATTRSPDQVRFEARQGVEYTIDLQFPTSPRLVIVSWDYALPPEHEHLEGGPGNDDFAGGKGSDYLRGNGGDDTLKGGKDDDWLTGGPGDDRLDGGPGNDVLQGNDDDDVLIGGPGSDRMSGDGGDDTLKGGRGNDFLGGGPGSGNDTLTGGKGKDHFVFGPLAGVNAQTGHIIITDFKKGDRIMLWLEGWPSVADIIASVVAKGSRHYVYTLAPGLTVETDVPLRAKDFVME